MGGFVAPCPSGLGPEPWSCSSPAVARNVSARRLDLMSAAERGRPALPRHRTPFSYTRELWDVQRFKERPPRPGFVISPTLGSAANQYLCSSRERRVFGRKSEN